MCEIKLQDESFSKRFTSYSSGSIQPKAPAGHSWESLMEMARNEARCAQKEGEVPVGAVVVEMGGTIVGFGHNRCIQDHDISAHAEIVALRCAGQTLRTYRFSSCIMVVTLEPCAMCTACILNARLNGVVFGARDHRAGAIVSSCSETFSSAFGVRIWYMGGVLGLLCAQDLQRFFAQRRCERIEEELLCSTIMSPQRIS